MGPTLAQWFLQTPELDSNDTLAVKPLNKQSSTPTFSLHSYYSPYGSMGEVLW